jgi:hypothetical protein
VSRETYSEWRRRVVRDTPGFGGPFWLIIDASWTPAEQNALARAWKEGTVV